MYETKYVLDKIKKATNQHPLADVLHFIINICPRCNKSKQFKQRIDMITSAYLGNMLKKVDALVN